MSNAIATSNVDTSGAPPIEGTGAVDGSTPAGDRPHTDEAISELIERRLPIVPALAAGSVDDMNRVDQFAAEANRLIADLRAQLIEMQFALADAERRSIANANVFSDVVDLGSETASVMIEEAKAEAVRILDAATAAAEKIRKAAAEIDDQPPADSGQPSTVEPVTFEQAWTSQPTFDERFAGAMFFETDVAAEQKARRWILDAAS